MTPGDERGEVVVAVPRDILNEIMAIARDAARQSGGVLDESSGTLGIEPEGRWYQLTFGMTR